MAIYSVCSRLHTPLRLRLFATPQEPNPPDEVIIAGVAPGDATKGTLLGDTTTTVDKQFFDQWLVQNVNSDIVTGGLISWS